MSPHSKVVGREPKGKVSLPEEYQKPLMNLTMKTVIRPRLWYSPLAMVLIAASASVSFPAISVYNLFREMDEDTLNRREFEKILLNPFPSSNTDDPFISVADTKSVYFLISNPPAVESMPIVALQYKAGVYGALYDRVDAVFFQCKGKEPFSVLPVNSSLSSADSELCDGTQLPVFSPRYIHADNYTVKVFLSIEDGSESEKVSLTTLKESILATAVSDPMQKGHKFALLSNGVDAVSICRGKVCPTKCPASCSVNGYPCLYDPVDKLCKSTHPTSLRLYKGGCSCRSTCYTAEAVHANSHWPWTSRKQEKDFEVSYQAQKQMIIDFKEGERQRKRQEYSPAVPRFNCSSYVVGQKNEHGKDSESATTMLPLPIYASLSHHTFFFPDSKLLFCGVPKVGITEWLKFLRFSVGAGDYLSDPHYKWDIRMLQLQQLGLKKASEIIQDTSWTKAVFFRDPAERLLSAYLDKFVGENYSRKIFARRGIHGTSERFTFPEFVDIIASNNTKCSDPRGLHACTDPHWRPQFMMCGMDYWFPSIDFVGDFKHLSIHTKQLLEQVGLWEEVGSKFDDGKGTLTEGGKCTTAPPSRTNLSDIFGFNQRGPSGGQKAFSHTRNAESKIKKYYTPELMEKVRTAYKVDFEIYDELKRRSGSYPPKAKDLSVVQAFCHEF